MDPQPPQESAASPRIASMDVVRGLVMVLMAIDHVRVYSGQPAGGPTAGIFFTRWITHFVAPGFVFFAGTGAFLHGTKLGDRGKLARFLVSRGALARPARAHVPALRVDLQFRLRALLARRRHLDARLVHGADGGDHLPADAGDRGAGHRDHRVPPDPLSGDGRGARRRRDRSSTRCSRCCTSTAGSRCTGKDGPPLLVLFVIVPWIGVMAAGYAFGPVMRWPAARRRAFCLRLGIGATALFVALRALDAFGDPRHWHAMMANGWPGLLAFLNTSKYPASLLFLLMTLGPLIALLPLVEGAKGWLAARSRRSGASRCSTTCCTFR